ncbi:MAG: hypothetical protein IPL33_14655 [Sphingobacteriales bacterium]|nr:hypothetical protein [Sphingobacteriales bacterium]
MRRRNTRVLPIAKPYMGGSDGGFKYNAHADKNASQPPQATAASRAALLPKYLSVAAATPNCPLGHR